MSTPAVKKPEEPPVAPVVYTVEFQGDNPDQFSELVGFTSEIGYLSFSAGKVVVSKEIADAVTAIGHPLYVVQES